MWPITLTRGMLRRVLRPIVSGHVLNGISEVFEAGADEFSARWVFLAGRVDGGNAREPLQEIDHLARDLIDRPQDRRFLFWIDQSS